MVTKRVRRWGGGLAALLFVITGCQSEQPTVSKPKPIRPDPDIAQVPTKQLRPYYNQNLSWEPCGEDSGDLECARVLVPLDYDHPSGERIEIAVNRLPATGPDPDRIGSLVLQPGGPGISGLAFTEQAAGLFDGPVRERFDLVGFDPRGVGESAPVQCLTDDEKDEYLAETGLVEASGDVDEALRLQQEFTEGCEEHSADLLAHVGTENVTRDLDVLRAVLGDRDLSYLGYSYGSMLGARYAEMFPAKYRALVLDGAMDPDADLLEQRMAQADGARHALRSFVRDCLDRDDCPLESTDPNAAIQQIVELWETSAEGPLSNTAAPDREVGPGWVAAGIRFGLYAETAWPDLRDALADAIEFGNGTALMRMADPFVGRAEDGSWDNSLDASVAITCADAPPVERDRAEQAGQDAGEQAERLGPFGPAADWAWLECFDWPVEVAEAKPLRVNATEPVLVVGTRRDPATPYEWARTLTEKLPGARLLTYEGNGHGAYRTVGSDCVDQAVDGYLIRGELPETDTRCPAVEPAEE